MLALFIAASLARQDIVEIRHERWPNHTDVLGWTDADKIVVRRTACGLDSGGGFMECRVTLNVVGGDDHDETILLSIQGDDSIYDEAKRATLSVSYEVARDFIHAEERALNALGELTAGGARERPFGYRARTYQRAAATFVGLYEGKRRLARVAKIPEDDRVDHAPAIRTVDDSPDGAYVGVVVDYTHAWDDCEWSKQAVVVVPAT